MAIHEWPEDDRPREKLIAHGGPALSDAELLAVFLGSGRKGIDAVKLGRELLTAAGGLRALIDADYNERSVGPATWCRLRAARELVQRYLAADLREPAAPFEPRACGRYFKLKLSHYPNEVFACLFLDTRHRVIGFEELFHGTISSTSVHPREVVRRCIARNAAAIVLGHNHPSGHTEPSPSDRAVTMRLKSALELIDVRLLDHFIVGNGPATSLAARGWI